MDAPDEKREWIDCFGACLMKLEPAMSAETAAVHAAAAYEDGKHLSPAEAVEIFAAEQPSGEAGAAQ